MLSLSEASGSVGSEGNPQATENSGPAGAVLNACVPANGTMPEMDEQMGAVADGPGATPPNDENGGVASARTGKVANTDTTVFDSPIFSRFQLGRR